MFLPSSLWETYQVNHWHIDDDCVWWETDVDHCWADVLDHMLNLVWLACWTTVVDVPPVRQWYL